ncbi:MAG TPA: DinB family protein [Ignavibacteriaceae bacterium]|nr:DinB family protein [Ignavibacteriaceae bacterium]
MKAYLIETFKFNSQMNKKVLEKIRELPDKSECIKFFSHLINSQKKWLARIVQYPKDPGLDWWKPEYVLDDLESEWDKSLSEWLEFIKSKKEVQLFEEVKFIGYDRGQWTSPLKDIALQLNYHSIHHRAQIQMLIRKQGFEPDFVDYIGTVYRKIK